MDAIVETRPSDFDKAVVAATAMLRMQIRGFCRDAGLGEDLLQQTVAKALRAHASFTPGSNMGAWLYTIAFREFLSLKRKLKREVEDVDGAYALNTATPASQHDSLVLKQTLEEINALPKDMRRAVRLVGMFGYTYEDAAKVEGVAIGTIKSRVSRARSMLRYDIIRDRLGKAGTMVAETDLEDDDLPVPMPQRRPAPTVLATPVAPRPLKKLRGRDLWERVKDLAQTIPTPEIALQAGLPESAVRTIVSGTTPPPRPPKYDSEKIIEMARDHTVAQIATAVGCTYQNVSYILRKRGIRALRAPQSVRGKVVFDHGKIAELARANRSDTDVARQIGCSPGLVYQVRSKMKAVDAAVPRDDFVLVPRHGLFTKVYPNEGVDAEMVPDELVGRDVDVVKVTVEKALTVGGGAAAGLHTLIAEKRAFIDASIKELQKEDAELEVAERVLRGLVSDNVRVS